MTFLGLGKPRKLEDLKIDDLRKERAQQEIKQDILLTALRRAQKEYDRLLEVASEPGINDAARNVAAYRMSHASKRRGRAEADLCRVITRMTVLDSAIDNISMKMDLQKRGVWKQIDELDKETLVEQLDAFVVRTKAADDKLEAMTEVNVVFHRGPEFDRARAAIEEAVSEKID